MFKLNCGRFSNYSIHLDYPAVQHERIILDNHTLFGYKLFGVFRGRCSGSWRRTVDRIAHGIDYRVVGLS